MDKPAELWSSVLAFAVFMTSASLGDPARVPPVSVLEISMSQRLSGTMCCVGVIKAHPHQLGCQRRSSGQTASPCAWWNHLKACRISLLDMRTVWLSTLVFFSVLTASYLNVITLGWADWERDVNVRIGQAADFRVTLSFKEQYKSAWQKHMKLYSIPPFFTGVMFQPQHIWGRCVLVKTA